MSADPAAARRLDWRPAARLALVLLAVGLLYLPALDYPFLALDDHYGVVDNPGLRDLSWKGIRFLFFEDQRDFRYFPTAYLSLAVDFHLFGMDPRAFHRTNVVLHLANTALVFALILALCDDRRVAFVTSLLFGIHPLQVESVAWVSSRKNGVFLLFFLLSALAYVGFVRARETRPRASRLALAASVLLFLLSATAKTTAVTLPAVLMLIDYQLSPRLPRSSLAFARASLPSKLLYLPVIAFVAFMTHLLARRSPYGVENGFDGLDWLLIGGHNFFFYVWKTVVPTGLGVFVPLPITPDGGVPGHFGVFAIGSLLGLGLCVWSWRRSRALFFACAWYLVTILPMVALQAFVDDVPILVADRYFYQSSIGVFYGLGVGGIALWDGAAVRARRIALAIVGAAALALLFVLAAQQLGVWRGTIPLYEQTVRHHPSDAFYNRLAMEYANQGDLARAFRALDDARTAPYQVEFARVAAYLMRISEIHRQKGDFARAAELQEAALEATPNVLEPSDARTPLAYLYTAHLYELAGNDARAAELAMRARSAKLDPKSFFESVWFAIAPEAAQRFLEKRVASAPEDAVSAFYLGQLHRLRGRPDRAAAYERRAAALGLRR